MKAIRLLVILGYAGFVIGWWMGLRIVTTPSVPRGLYTTHGLRSVGELERGAFVCVRALSDYAPKALHDVVIENDLPVTWIKEVAGLPGDLVTHATGPDRLEVNGNGLAYSSLLSTDSQGRTLPVQSFPTRLAPGEVWLSSRHERGYDSRYFGPVDMRALNCIAEPLWIL